MADSALLTASTYTIAVELRREVAALVTRAEAAGSDISAKQQAANTKLVELRQRIAAFEQFAASQEAVALAAQAASSATSALGAKGAAVAASAQALEHLVAIQGLVASVAQADIDAATIIARVDTVIETAIAVEQARAQVVSLAGQVATTKTIVDQKKEAVLAQAESVAVLASSVAADKAVAVAKAGEASTSAGQAAASAAAADDSASAAAASAVAAGNKITGPASAVDGHVALFDGETGKLVKSGGPYAPTEIASSPEMIAGTNNTKVATPKGVKDSVLGNSKDALLAGMLPFPGFVARTVLEKAADLLHTNDFPRAPGEADDTARLQRAINAAANSGRPLWVGREDEEFEISAPLTSATNDYNLAPGVTGLLREGEIHRVTLIGNGATIKATAAMSHMLHYVYYAPLGNPAPFSSKISGIRLNGNGLAQVGIYSEWSINLIIEHNTMVWGVTDTCYDLQGYGVLHMRDSYGRGPTCVSIGRGPNFGGGDSVIDACDFYPSQCGIYLGGWSGNTTIAHTTMTRDYGVVGDDIWGVRIDGTTVSDGSKQVNDINIYACEFRGLKVAKATRSPNARNLYNLTLRDCHTNFWDSFGYATIADLTGWDDAKIEGNFMGYGIASDVAGVGVILNDCRRVQIHGNHANNLTTKFAELVDCLDCNISWNIIRNAGKASASDSIITVAASGAGGLTLRNRFTDNKLIQGSTAYGQTFLTEGANCNYTSLVNNELTGAATEAVLVGTNSFRATLGSTGTAAGATRQRFGGSARLATPGGDVLYLLDVPNAINGLQVRGAATGNAIVVEAVGSDADVWLQLAAKGTGILQLLSHTRFGAGKFLQRTQATGLVAAGANQGAALLLSSDINEVSTVAASTGVRLDASQREVFIANSGANALLVYPPTGATINALAANAGYSLAAGSVARCVAVSGTKWFVS